MKSLSVCLLASGSLGFALLEHLFCKSGIALHSVFTDKKSEGIIVFCKEKNFPCFVGNPRGNASESFRKKIAGRPDILLSVNYLFLIEEDLISYPVRYALNVHGSLLPKYRGRAPHVWAIINGEKETGITAHLITRDCDKGAVVAQKRIAISSSDTGGSVLKKYKDAYPELIDEVIQNINAGALTFAEQDESRATYFPKRTPDDGEIDFNWQRERVYNWVRAMAPPEYPGAFFYDGKSKVVVQKASFSDLGFAPGTQNGAVILKDETAYVVKTPNGCVVLQKFDGGGYRCRVHFSNTRKLSFKAGSLCA